MGMFDPITKAAGDVWSSLTSGLQPPGVGTHPPTFIPPDYNGATPYAASTYTPEAGYSAIAPPPTVGGVTTPGLDPITGKAQTDLSTQAGTLTANAGTLADTSKTLLNAFSTGTLTPGQQAEISLAEGEAKAQIQQQAANAGMSTSSVTAGEMAKLSLQTAALKEQMLQGDFSNAMTAMGLSSQMLGMSGSELGTLLGFGQGEQGLQQTAMLENMKAAIEQFQFDTSSAIQQSEFGYGEAVKQKEFGFESTVQQAEFGQGQAQKDTEFAATLPYEAAKIRDEEYGLKQKGEAANQRAWFDYADLALNVGEDVGKAVGKKIGL